MVLAVFIAGCGGDTHFPVKGNLTLDGAPLVDATISFVPQGGKGTPAIGRTDNGGSYVINVSSDQLGMEPGEYSVRITTYDEGNAEADPPLPRIPERVPVKYNLDSTLTAVVEPQENVFDFALDSKGEIYQP